ncbi:hypothetical protein DY000_02025495 [Brassica cretica]|uniref:Secreted protein n=1 Tax=Brassica cretica TaxID=69181 RepID=A0ABQ7EA92_BRACR|nr:hypothetical protein DY000_02025495 [Brassica cretica]
MAALLSAPDMLAALVIVAVSDYLVSPADRNSCVVLRSLVFRRGFLRGSGSPTEGGSAWGSEQHHPLHIRCYSACFGGSRWTFVAMASSRRARWPRFCRVSVSSSPVKCVQVKGLEVSLTSMYGRFEASNLLLLSVAPPPSIPFLQALSYRFWFSDANRVRAGCSFPVSLCVRLDTGDRSFSGFFFAGNSLVRFGCCYLRPIFLLREMKTEVSLTPVV